MPHRSQASCAAQMVHSTRRVSTWAAISANQRHIRNAALMFMLTDVHLGDISDELAAYFGVGTGARRVLISHRTQQHIIERRGISAQMDVDLVVHRLSEGLANMRYWLLPQKNPNVFELVSFVPSVKRYLVVVLKLVRDHASKSKKDEWWIKTAFPFGQKKVNKSLAAGRMKELPSIVWHSK